MLRLFPVEALPVKLFRRPPFVERSPSTLLSPPAELLDEAGYQPGQKLLVVGDGAVATEALRRGAAPETVTLVARSRQDVEPRLRQLNGHLVRVLRRLAGAEECFELVVCREAIPPAPDVLGAVAALLRPDAQLVFCTVVRPQWRLRLHKWQGQRVLEAAGAFGHRVGHLRIGRQETEVSFSRLQEDDLLVAGLARAFDVDVRRGATTSLWRCHRKASPDEEAVPAVQAA